MPSTQANDQHTISRLPDDGWGQFAIPAVSPIHVRRPRTLKHGDTFGVFDHYGNVLSDSGSPEGVFHKDTRYLSDLRLLINGRQPLLLSSTVDDNNALMTADLTNPDFVDRRGALVLPKDTVHIVRSKFLWDNACYERLGIRYFGDVPFLVQLTLLFACDFADLFEVRGHERDARGSISVTARTDRVVFTYRGLDNIKRSTHMRFDPIPALVNDKRAVWELKLEPNAWTSLFSIVACEQPGTGGPRRQRRFISGMRAARKELKDAAQRAAAVETSNEVVNEVLCRSMADLNMLVTDKREGPYPYAGIPWFCTPFGRDGLITAIQMLWADPELARGVLRFLARTQATGTDPASEAEPGKVMHEMRSGEMAQLGQVPFARYYGSVDATPLFVTLAGLYFERTGDLTTVDELWPNIARCLAWIDANCAQSERGFATYRRGQSAGLANQGWKDSHDSVFHADGSAVSGAVALCEVQGYVYAAKMQASAVAKALGFATHAQDLEREAADFRTRFESAFWCSDIGTYAIALDGDGRSCRVRSSNAGHLLFSGIAAPERARRVADQLVSQKFFSGWGVRTVASSEARYNPMSYHNGSVWPHDNAMIGLGFARYGFKSHLLKLVSGVFDAAAYMDLRRLPELFCGFKRLPGRGPTFYPVACAPQAWASAAPFALLQASLGIEISSHDNTIRFRQPRLPETVEEVVIRAVPLGPGGTDILLRRHGTNVSVNVLDRADGVHVEVLV